MKRRICDVVKRNIRNMILEMVKTNPYIPNVAIVDKVKLTETEAGVWEIIEILNELKMEKRIK